MAPAPWHGGAVINVGQDGTRDQVMIWGMHAGGRWRGHIRCMMCTVVLMMVVAARAWDWLAGCLLVSATADGTACMWDCINGYICLWCGVHGVWLHGTFVGTCEPACPALSAAGFCARACICVFPGSTHGGLVLGAVWRPPAALGHSPHVPAGMMVGLPARVGQQGARRRACQKCQKAQATSCRVCVGSAHCIVPPDCYAEHQRPCTCLCRWLLAGFVTTARCLVFGV